MKEDLPKVDRSKEDLRLKAFVDLCVLPTLFFKEATNGQRDLMLEYPQGVQYIIKEPPTYTLPNNPAVNLEMNNPDDDIGIVVDKESLDTLGFLNVSGPKERRSINYMPKKQGTPFTITVDHGTLQIDGDVSADEVLETLNPLFLNGQKNQDFRSGKPFLMRVIRNLSNYTLDGKHKVDPAYRVPGNPILRRT